MEETKTQHKIDKINESSSYQNSSKSKKCFVGGMLNKIEKSKLIKYFEQFGSIKSLKYPSKNKKKRKSKGHVVIEFKNKDSLKKVLHEKINHKIGDINLRVEKLISRDQAKKKLEEEIFRKIFVKGLPRKVTEQEIIDHFKKYGKVEQVLMQYGFKKNKWKFKQFAFILMKNEKSVKKACQKKYQKLGNKTIAVTKARCKSKNQQIFGKNAENVKCNGANISQPNLNKNKKSLQVRNKLDEEINPNCSNPGCFSTKELILKNAYEVNDNEISKNLRFNIIQDDRKYLREGLNITIVDLCFCNENLEILKTSKTNYKDLECNFKMNYTTSIKAETKLDEISGVHKIYFVAFRRV